MIMRPERFKRRHGKNAKHFIDCAMGPALFKKSLESVARVVHFPFLQRDIFFLLVKSKQKVLK